MMTLLTFDTFFQTVPTYALQGTRDTPAAKGSKDRFYLAEIKCLSTPPRFDALWPEDSQPWRPRTPQISSKQTETNEQQGENKTTTVALERIRAPHPSANVAQPTVTGRGGDTTQTTRERRRGVRLSQTDTRQEHDDRFENL